MAQSQLVEQVEEQIQVLLLMPHCVASACQGAPTMHLTPQSWDELIVPTMHLAVWVYSKSGCSLVA